jgi:hypothetical protein
MNQAENKSEAREKIKASWFASGEISERRRAIADRIWYKSS